MQIKLVAALVIASFVVVGCATFDQIEHGLNALMGKDKEIAFSVLGYPSSSQQFEGKTIYIWGVSGTDVVMMAQTSNTYGTVGNTPVNASTRSYQAVPMNYNCQIKIAADAQGTLIRWEAEGNLAGCENYISRLDKYADSQKITKGAP